MLLKAGFSILKVYGDYNEGPFIETKSRRIIVIGQKIKEIKI
jgi:hypothetical protein